MKSNKKNTKQDPLEEAGEEIKDTKKTRTICQSKDSKSLPSDPWQLVAHTDLSSRKILIGTKAKTKVKAMQITSQKRFSKMSGQIIINHTPLQQRKATRVNLTQWPILQVIKNTLKDYNSIEFLTQDHIAE
jgi:hypothetical protein